MPVHTCNFTHRCNRLENIDRMQRFNEHPNQPDAQLVYGVGIRAKVDSDYSLELLFEWSRRRWVGLAPRID